LDEATLRLRFATCTTFQFQRKLASKTTLQPLMGLDGHVDGKPLRML